MFCRNLLKYKNYIINMIKNIYDYDTNGLNMPTSCPCCGGDLEVLNNGMVKCINPNCQQKLSHKIFSFLISMGVKGAGRSFVADAIKEVKDLPDFISRINETDDASYVRWAGGVNGKKVADRVRKNLKKPITISKFLACFDVEGIGEGQINKVLEAKPEADLKFFLQPTSAEQFVCRGIGNELANKMYYGFLERAEEIEACILFFNVQKNKPKEEVKDGKLLGLSFCFTGKAEAIGSRNQCEKLVVENGGTVSAVKKGLSYLVTDDVNSGSSKNKKAAELGIPVITSFDFKKMIES